MLASAFTEPKQVVNHSQDGAGLGVGGEVAGDLVGLGYGTRRFFPPPFFVLNSSRPVVLCLCLSCVFLKAVHITAENYGAYAARPEELAKKAKQSEEQNYMSEELSCSESHE